MSGILDYRENEEREEAEKEKQIKWKSREKRQKEEVEGGRHQKEKKIEESLKTTENNSDFPAVMTSWIVKKI